MGTPSKFQGVGSSSSRSKSAPSPKSANRSVRPFLPDVTKGFYATDNFRMYSYKINMCSYDGNHDWSQCPYTHTGDSARRRNPCSYFYEWKPCNNFTNGRCELGDDCTKAHGDYEKGLHPDFYRTELCSDKPPCTRPICFYAHTREELRKPCISASLFSIYTNDIARGFEPCPIDALPPTPVTLPKSPSTIEISNNAPNNPVESSNGQNLPYQPSLSAADSPSPETSTFSNVEDGFPGKKIRRYSDLFLPPLKLAASDQSQKKQIESMQSSSKTDFSPTHINHSHPCLSESPSTTGISNNDSDYNPLEGLSSNEQSLPPQPSLSESPSTILISNSSPDNPLEGSSSNEQSLPSQPSLSEYPSTIEISNNAPYELLEGSSLNEQSLPSQTSLSESLSTIRISNNGPDNPLESLSSHEKSLRPQPSLGESPSTILISNSAPDNPLEGSSSNEQSLPSQPSLSESPFTVEISNNAPDNTPEVLSSNEQSHPSQPSLSESPSTIAISNNAPDYTLGGLSSNEQSILSRPSLSAPALQATQPRQIQSPSSRNPASSSSAADNAVDDEYPDVSWVEDLLDEPQDQSSPPTTGTNE